MGFSTYYNFNKCSWWNSFSGFNVNYQNVKSKVDFIKSVDGYNGFIFSNNEFTLNTSKTISLGLNYALQLPGRNQIFYISTINVLDVSMKFLLLNQNLSITVTGEDLVDAQRPLMTYYSNGVKNDIKSYDDTRGFRISLNYKFGNNNIASKKRDFGNEDERSRAN